MLSFIEDVLLSVEQDRRLIVFKDFSEGAGNGAYCKVSADIRINEE